MTVASANKSRISMSRAHATSSTPLPKSKRHPSPFHQGALDGLCSIYSIINAVRLLHEPALKPCIAFDLFEILFDKLSARLGPSESLCRGAESADLRALLRHTRKTLREQTDIRISISRIKLDAHSRRLDVVWSTLRKRFDDGAVAIIGLEGFHAHWTVGYRATAKTIRLFDSGGLRVLTRRHCSLRSDHRRHHLIPEDIFIVSRGRRKRT